MRELPRNMYVVKTKGVPVAYVIRLVVNKETTEKTFRFKKYDNEEVCFEKAYEFLNILCKEKGVEFHPKKKTPKELGVTRTERIDKSGGRSRYKAHWQAQWTSQGKPTIKRFSILTHGEEKAEQLAIDARKHAMTAIQKGKDPIFVPPKSKRTKLWRYMDFTKFVSMIDNSGIYFSQVDLLGDPYEGSYSLGNRKNRHFVYSRNENPEKKIEDLVSEIKDRRPGIMISCWHLSDHESAAMWKLYAKSNEAVCIQTTFGNISEALSEETNFGLVNYVDYDKHWIPESSYYYPFLYKRKSFEHEREIRALVDMKEIKRKELFKGDNNGVWCPIDLDRLIETVYVSPDSPQWFYDLTKSICSKYELNCSVVNSKLSGMPIY